MRKATTTVMLPAFICLNTIFGVLFALDPQDRLSKAPSLDAARDAFPLWVWAAMWLGLAGLMTLAWRTHQRDRLLFALMVNRIVWFGWALLVESAVLTQPAVSFLAGVPLAFVGVATWATIRDLRSASQPGKEARE